MTEANNDEVICPNCVTQFRAIPVNVQEQMRQLEAEVERLTKVDVEPIGQYRGDGTFHWYPPHPKHLWKDVDLVPASALAAAQADAARYRALRRGQKWSVIDGIGESLRAEALDAAIDAVLKGMYETADL